MRAARLLAPDAGEEPRQSEAEEYVDGVGAGDVADGGVCVLRTAGGSH
jgi:sugar/nucleoside kinase (ribokinase family)